MSYKSNIWFIIEIEVMPTNVVNEPLVNLYLIIITTSVSYGMAKAP